RPVATAAAHTIAILVRTIMASSIPTTGRLGAAAALPYCFLYSPRGDVELVREDRPRWHRRLRPGLRGCHVRAPHRLRAVPPPGGRERRRRGGDVRGRRVPHRAAGEHAARLEDRRVSGEARRGFAPRRLRRERRAGGPRPLLRAGLASPR